MGRVYYETRQLREEEEEGGEIMLAIYTRLRYQLIECRFLIIGAHQEDCRGASTILRYIVALHLPVGDPRVAGDRPPTRACHLATTSSLLPSPLPPPPVGFKPAAAAGWLAWGEPVEGMMCVSASCSSR